MLGDLGVVPTESPMQKNTAGDVVRSPANHISEQNPLSILEALKTHLLEWKQICGCRMHVDARQ